MQDNKITLNIPNQLKIDLYNTKTLDGEKQESFFSDVNLLDTIKLGNNSFSYFENEFNFNLDIYQKLLNLIYLSPKSKKELIDVKKKLYYLEKFYLKYHSKDLYLKKFDYFSFSNSSFYNQKIEKELSEIYTKFDYFNKNYFNYKNRKKINLIQTIYYKVEDYFIIKSFREVKKYNKGIENSVLGKLYTNSLKILTKEILIELKHFKCDLSLNGLHKIPKGILSELNNLKGILSLNGLTILPKEIASELKTFKGGLSLNGLREITKESASELKYFQGYIISLNGLKILPKEIASELKNFKGNRISLNGLEELSKETASELKYFKGYLSFNGLREITKESANELKYFKGYLSLNGLKELSKETASELKYFKGDWLSLDGLKKITKNIASELKYFKGYLSLNGLKELSKEIAKELNNFEGKYLSLNGLKNLNHEVIIELNNFEGELSLNGLEKLSYEVSVELNNFEGELSLNGLKEITKEVASELSKFKGNRISLNGLRQITKEVASELSKFKGNRISLNGLTEITEEIVNELNNFTGYLSLNGIQKLTRETANKLNSFIGNLSFKGLKFIDQTNNLSGKKQEIYDFISNYSSGACLVSGYRGIGKTSTIKLCVEYYKENNNNLTIIPIIINIPEKNSDGKFDKNEIINRIIVKMFEEIDSYKYIPKNFKNKIFEQYQRVYHDIENKNLISMELKEHKLNLNIKNIIFLILIISLGSIFYKKDFDIIAILPVGFGAIIVGKITSYYYIKYEQKQMREMTIKELYNSDIAETRLVKNIGRIKKGFNFRDIFKKIGNDIILFFSYISKNLIQSFGALIVLVFGFTLSYIYCEDVIIFIKFLDRLVGKEINMSGISVVFSNLPKEINIVILFSIYLLCIYFLLKIRNNIFYKPTKFIFVIDELDKLLDFEKSFGEKAGIQTDSKQKINMKQVFEILGKLKTLFFETNGALFFVVTNKQAYDYYLQNKHQEDDIISNIFNKIIYLPVNNINNFNLNYKVEISETHKNKIENLEENKLLRDQIKKYIYFKSHGNWRKSRFELSHMISGSFIELKKDDFDFEYKFYDFFDKLYQTFEKNSLEKYSNKKNIFEDFLFSMNGEDFKDGYVNKLFEKQREYNFDNQDTNDIELKQILNDDNYLMYKKIIDDESKEKLSQLRNEIKIKFYSIYLSKVRSLIQKKKSECSISEDTDLFVLEYIDFIQKEFKEDDFSRKNFFGYFIASIEKISLEYAYRDYIINYLLSIYENIKFLRKTTLDEILQNIKINNDDLTYPVFTDLILYWLPLMLIYFSNIEPIGKKNDEKND